MGGYPGAGSDNKPRDCRKCDIAWGLIGAVFGTAILIVAADLISGGAITRAVTRSGTVLATVTPIRSEVNDDAG